MIELKMLKITRIIMMKDSDANVYVIMMILKIVRMMISKIYIRIMRMKTIVMRIKMTRMM